MKKFLVTMMLFALLTPMSSCGDDDDPWEDWGINETLLSCPILGVYEGVIINYSVSEKDNAVWCEITSAPEEANTGHYPNVRSYIYFKRSDCAGVNLVEGQHISFYILKYGSPPPGLYFLDRTYFSCVINLINVPRGRFLCHDSAPELLHMSRILTKSANKFCVLFPAKGLRDKRTALLCQ